VAKNRCFTFFRRAIRFCIRPRPTCIGGHLAQNLPYIVDAVAAALGALAVARAQLLNPYSVTDYYQSLHATNVVGVLGTVVGAQMQANESTQIIAPIMANISISMLFTAHTNHLFGSSMSDIIFGKHQKKTQKTCSQHLIFRRLFSFFLDWISDTGGPQATLISPQRRATACPRPARSASSRTARTAITT
jgi:hypothetical protein